jgi:hypothetical protein
VSRACPWCGDPLDERFVRSLGRIAEPCPACGRPIRESCFQVLFSALCSIPIAAVILYLSYALYELGSRAGAGAVMLCGIVFWVYLHKYIPVVNGPAKGANGRYT